MIIHILCESKILYVKQSFKTAHLTYHAIIKLVNEIR